MRDLKKDEWSVWRNPQWTSGCAECDINFRKRGRGNEARVRFAETNSPCARVTAFQKAIFQEHVHSRMIFEYFQYDSLLRRCVRPCNFSRWIGHGILQPNRFRTAPIYHVIPNYCAEQLKYRLCKVMCCFFAVILDGLLRLCDARNDRKNQYSIHRYEKNFRKRMRLSKKKITRGLHTNTVVN